MAAARPVLVGMEATGNSQWFVELVEDLGHTVWIGDAAQIRASYVRRQKTDKRDAAHILKLLLENWFPRLWMPDREQRDLRQLVLHRHKLVIIRARVKNELQHLALNRGCSASTSCQGAHPGLSDEEDSTFRLHLVLLLGRVFLRRFDKLRRHP